MWCLFLGIIIIMRTGLIALKLGMSRVLTDDGLHVPVTICKLDKCRVISVKNKVRDGYTALQLGSGIAKIKNTSKPLRGHFVSSKAEPAKKLAEFRVRDDNIVEAGHTFSVDHFTKGQHVDATSVSIGKGFAGTIKRHNFSGMCASHGVSISHRSQGSTGQCQDPGKVFKGTKMAGHMGSKKVTVQNLVVHSLDVGNNLIFLKGSIPGHTGSYVFLKDAVKKN
jgi:large subunit ribosomal protein L3